MAEEAPEARETKSNGKPVDVLDPEEESVPEVDKPETVPMAVIEAEAEAIAALYAESEADMEEDGEAGEFDDLPSAAQERAIPKAKTALLSLEAASSKIDPKALEMLKEKFNGTPLSVRHLEDRDTLF